MSDEQEQQEPQPTPGKFEQKVIDLFDEKGWRSVSLTQLGPDGTEQLGQLIFHVCPVCAATVAEGNNVLLLEHETYHVEEAGSLDEIQMALQHLLRLTQGMVGPE